MPVTAGRPAVARVISSRLIGVRSRLAESVPICHSPPPTFFVTASCSAASLQTASVAAGRLYNCHSRDNLRGPRKSFRFRRPSR